MVARKPFYWGVGSFLCILILFTGYLLLWPVPVEPKEWDAPKSNGYTGRFAANKRLRPVQKIPIGNNTGPESLAIDAAGNIFAATHEGNIVRISPSHPKAENWISTRGRPLGITFDHQGNLIVADAFKGLLHVTPKQKITILTDKVGNSRLCYVNNAAVAKDGRIFFSDSSSKFCAEKWGGTYPASLLDIMEHGGHGRLLMFDPKSKETTTLMKGLQFANGVALAPDDRFVLVVETGAYRVVKYWLDGPQKGTHEILIDNLPGFPDNLTTGMNGRFWLAFISPRSAPLDAQSQNPFVRKIIQRLPSSIRPKATPYGHICAIDEDGEVVADFQDPSARFPMNTEVLETDTEILLGSLFTDHVGKLDKKTLKLLAQNVH